MADKTITQKQAGEELGITVRHARRLIKKLRDVDRAVIHALRGRPSNRRLAQSRRADIIEILSAPVYAGFGLTLAAEL